MSSDSIRWMSTTLIAGLIVIISTAFMGILALQNKPASDTLAQIALVGSGAFFTGFGSMIGARASQNGQQLAMNHSA